MKKHRKKHHNLAVILIVVATICISAIQFGYSYLSSSLMFGGVATIVTTPSGSTIADILKEANSGNNFVIDDFSGDPVNTAGLRAAQTLGYSLIFRAAATDTINNYIKFSTNATEIWRIIGITNDGIKVVCDTPITTTGVYWGSGSGGATRWVQYNTTSTVAPFVINVTSLTGSSVLCNYLNSTYYNSLTSTSNVNYLNPLYFNHAPVWDLTPMNHGVYMSEDGSKAIYTNVTVGAGFVGLPVGVITPADFNLVSATFPSATTTAGINGWLHTNVNEYTMAEYITTPVNTLAYSTNNVNIIEKSKINHTGKGNSRYYRPCLYLNNNITLTGGGTQANPFVVTGIGA